MQGTSLDEVFGNNFGSPIDFEGGSFPPLFGIRRTPVIPMRDVSGSALNQMSQQALWNSLSEELPVLDTNMFTLRSAVDDYRNLRNYRKYLSDEIDVCERNITQLEKAQNDCFISTQNYTNEVLRMGILTREEFDTIREKMNELQTLQREAADKCLNNYKKQGADLHAKLLTTNTNLSSYRDFIREGTKEMLGPDVKPNTCSICLENEITHCLVPCGHTFCLGCIDKSKGNSVVTETKCMTCRTPCKSSIKLFLGL